MSEFAKRVAELPPEKRRLMELLLAEQATSEQTGRAAYVGPRTEVEETLTTIWEQVLQVKPIGVHDNFLGLGGDSIQCIQIVARARKAGLRITTNQLFEHPTVAELANAAGPLQQEEIEQEDGVGPIPLTPIQSWFFEQNLVRPQHWNQAVVLELKMGYDPRALAEAFRQVTQRHDALRLRFKKDMDGWRQEIGDFVESQFLFIDLSILDAVEQDRNMVDETAKLQRGFDLSTGPLIKAALFNLGAERPASLLFAAHHLAVDGVSLRTLLEDFQTAYQQLINGESVRLPEKTASFRRWARLLQEQARSAKLRSEVAFWAEEQRGSALPIPRDFAEGSNTEASARTITEVFDELETRTIIQKSPLVYRTQTNELLLTALVHAASSWIGGPTLLLDLEGHGREEILEGLDLSRTIGWFTSIFPLRLSVAGADDILDRLQLIKEQIRRTPNKGIGYGMLRYLSGDAEIIKKLRSLPQAEIVFNYLGQFDQIFTGSPIFRNAHEPVGSLYDPQGIRPHVLQIYGGLIQGRLQMNWVYSSNIHKHDTIEALARRFAATVRDLIRRSQDIETEVLAPSDFPEAELSQGELDHLLKG